MNASKALDHIRRHGSPRDVQTALYYVTRGRTAHLVELAQAVTPAQASVEQLSSSDGTPARAASTAPLTVELPV